MGKNILQLEVSRPVGFRYLEPGFQSHSNSSNNFVDLIIPDDNANQIVVLGEKIDASTLNSKKFFNSCLVTPVGIILKPLLYTNQYPVASKVSNKNTIDWKNNTDSALEEYPFHYLKEDRTVFTNFTPDKFAVMDLSSEIHLKQYPNTKFADPNINLPERVIYCKDSADLDSDGGPRQVILTYINTPFAENQGIYFAYNNYSRNTYFRNPGPPIGNYSEYESNLLRNCSFILTIADKELSVRTDNGFAEAAGANTARRSEFWFMPIIGCLRVVLYDWFGNIVLDKTVRLNKTLSDMESKKLIVTTDGQYAEGIQRAANIAIFPLKDNLCIVLCDGTKNVPRNPSVFTISLKDIVNSGWCSYGHYTDPISGEDDEYPIIFPENSRIYLNYKKFAGWFDIHRLRFSEGVIIKSKKLAPGYKPAVFDTWIAATDEQDNWFTAPPNDSEIVNAIYIPPAAGFASTTNIRLYENYSSTGDETTWEIIANIELDGVSCAPSFITGDFYIPGPASGNENQFNFPTHTSLLCEFFVDFPTIWKDEETPNIDLVDDFKSITITKSSNMRPGDANAAIFDGVMDLPINSQQDYYIEKFKPNRQMCVNIVMNDPNETGSQLKTKLGTYYLDEYRREFRGFNSAEINVSGRCLMKYFEEHMTERKMILDGLNHKDAMQKIINYSGLSNYYRTISYFDNDGVAEIYAPLCQHPVGGAEKLYEFSSFTPYIDLAKGIRGFSGWALFSDYNNKLYYRKVFEENRFPRVCFLTDKTWDWVPYKNLKTEEYSGLDESIRMFYMKNYAEAEYDIYKTRVDIIGKATESRDYSKPPIPGPVENTSNLKYNISDWIKGYWKDDVMEAELGDSRPVFIKDLLFGDYQAIGTVLLNIARYFKSGYRTIMFDVDEDSAKFLLFELMDSHTDNNQTVQRPLDLFDPIIVADRCRGYQYFFIKNLTWTIDPFTVNLRIEAQYFDPTYAYYSS